MADVAKRRGHSSAENLDSAHVSGSYLVARDDFSFFFFSLGPRADRLFWAAAVQNSLYFASSLARDPTEGTSDGIGCYAVDCVKTHTDLLLFSFS